MGVLMQMSSYLASIGGRAKLQWRPREQNIEADDITNCRFDRFDLGLRLSASLRDYPVLIFYSLQAAHSEFVEFKAKQRLRAPKPAPTSKKQNFTEKTAW